MSQERRNKVGRSSEDFFQTPDSERKSEKKFKKQSFRKASDKEKKLFSISTPLRNESLISTEIVWFDPVVDPKKFVLKHPTRLGEGGVSILLFASTSDNKSVEVLPMRHLTVGTGFCLHTGLYENQSVFGDYPNWYASITGLSAQMNEGVFVGSFLVDPHDRSELKISMFNMGNQGFVIRPMDPIAQVVFNGCHVPDIAAVSNLSERFEGEI